MAQNNNQLDYNGQMLQIDDVIKGQTVLNMYDPLRQMALQPDLRKGTILPYMRPTIWSLVGQLMSHLGTDTRTIKSREYYQSEYTDYGTFAVALNKSNNAVPSAGTSVTVTMSRFSASQNGNFAKMLSGYKGFINELGHQTVSITSAIPNSSGTFDVTLAPINGQVLDLTKRSKYTLVVYSLRSYDITSTNEIRTKGLVPNPPLLRKSFIQKYEDGIAVNQDEIDNYIYTKDFKIQKGIDMDGNTIDYFYSPYLTKVAMDWVQANRAMKTIFGERDNTNQQDFDGLKTTIKKYGMLDFAYDPFVSVSFKSLIFAAIKSLRKVNGSTENFLLHDFQFGYDWSDAIAALVRTTGQNLNFSLFGNGGQGMQDFEWYAFKNFTVGNYKWMTQQMDLFDDPRFGRPLENFAFIIPAKKTRDTAGNSVPAMSYVQLEGAEPAKTENVWVDDARPRGGRNMRVFVQDTFGCEFHLPSMMGMIHRAG